MNYPYSVLRVPLILAVILLACFIISSVNAQNFKEGFIISYEGDSTNGFVNFTDKKIFKNCQFKSSIYGEVIKYSPKEIKGFRFNEGKYFVSKTLIVDGKETRLFLEYIIEGKANIYYYRDDRDHYFIDTEDSELIELTQKQAYYKRDDSRPYELPKRHKQKLKLVLKDCPEIYPQIDMVSLNHKPLTKLAISYHYQICDTEDCIVFERKTNKVFGHYWRRDTYLKFRE